MTEQQQIYREREHIDDAYRRHVARSKRLVPLIDSFLFAHCKAALAAEPTWTLEMYCAYNDVSDETREELRALLTPKETNR